MPTPQMRDAMRDAEVGDDVMGEDPTVKRLEQMAAERMGMEAGLFVASGTMANQVSVFTHTTRGQEMIIEENAHILNFEAGAIAAFAGVQPKPLPSVRGAMNPADVEECIRPDNEHFPRTGLITVENTHNMEGGAALPVENMAAVIGVGRRHDIPVHTDGARIFNAAIALGVPAAQLVAGSSSVAFCLSKGLGCPVGSLITGAADFIAEARRARKMFGGGMRQVGVIAAAGVVALETMVDRLAQDHEHARLLADALADLPGVTLDPAEVESNIIIFEFAREGMDAQQLSAAMRERGVLVNPRPRIQPREPDRVRVVTHNDVSREDVDCAIGAFRELLA
ncbi:MAG: GntG family PLP-dependent aldolase [Armatimonadota bacterium]